LEESAPAPVPSVSQGTADGLPKLELAGVVSLKNVRPARDDDWKPAQLGFCEYCWKVRCAVYQYQWTTNTTVNPELQTFKKTQLQTFERNLHAFCTSIAYHEHERVCGRRNEMVERNKRNKLGLTNVTKAKVELHDGLCPSYGKWVQLPHEARLQLVREHAHLKGVEAFRVRRHCLHEKVDAHNAQEATTAAKGALKYDAISFINLLAQLKAKACQIDKRNRLNRDRLTAESVIDVCTREPAFRWGRTDRWACRGTTPLCQLHVHMTQHGDRYDTFSPSEMYRCVGNALRHAACSEATSIMDTMLNYHPEFYLGILRCLRAFSKVVRPKVVAGWEGTKLEAFYEGLEEAVNCFKRILQSALDNAHKIPDLHKLLCRDGHFSTAAGNFAPSTARGEEVKSQASALVLS
jgi:hypothetical protein